jgi:hypothetical protein
LFVPSLERNIGRIIWTLDCYGRRRREKAVDSSESERRERGRKEIQGK